MKQLTLLGKNGGVYMEHRWAYVTEKSANQMQGSADSQLHILHTVCVGGLKFPINDYAILTLSLKENYKSENQNSIFI